MSQVSERLFIFDETCLTEQSVPSVWGLSWRHKTMIWTWSGMSKIPGCVKAWQNWIFIANLAKRSGKNVLVFFDGLYNEMALMWVL